MPVFLSILRGINVGGNRKVPMAQLRALYETLGFKNVITYIQSGNVVFEWDGTKDPAQSIEAAISKEFGFEVPVIARSKSDLEAIFAGNPFLREADTAIEKLHVTFLDALPDKVLTAKIEVPGSAPDQFIISGKEIYLHVPGSYGETKLSNAFFETKLKVRATTRNWKTVTRLREMMSG